MPEFLENFISWYIAPWRRLNRKEFGIALLVVSVPSLLGLFFLIEGAGGYLGPLIDLVMAMKGISAGGDVTGALEAAQNAMNSFQGNPEDQGIHWLSLLNNLLLLAMFPLCRMRLRDMGYVGRQELGWAIAFSLSAVNGVCDAVLGYGVLPLGWLWSILNFGGYAWLSMARGATYLAVHERMDYTVDDTHGAPPRKDDDGSY